MWLSGKLPYLMTIFLFITLVHGHDPRGGSDQVDPNMPQQNPDINPTSDPHQPDNRTPPGDKQPPNNPSGRLPPMPPRPDKREDDPMTVDTNNDNDDLDEDMMEVDSVGAPSPKNDYNPYGGDVHGQRTPIGNGRTNYQAFPTGSSNAGWYFLAVFLGLTLVILVVVTLLVRSMAERRRRELEGKREEAIRAAATAEALKDRRTSVIVIREPAPVAPQEQEDAFTVPKSKRRKASVEAVDISKLDF